MIEYFASLNRMLSTLPDLKINSDKEDLKENLKNLLYSIKTNSTLIQTFQEMIEIYESIINKINSIDSFDNSLFYNFKKVLFIQEKVMLQLIDGKKLEEKSEIVKKMINQADLIIKKDERVLLTYLLENPSNMRDILKLLDINKMLYNLNRKLEMFAFQQEFCN
ncbi:MAG: hypothetical protein ACP5G3_04455 [Sulfurihydrogenibium sp.]|uniref:hypothetical protein n=1 Tax=Sulfurihydrogenibium sp. TaxID=2053621 RepID=UPI003D120FEC